MRSNTVSSVHIPRDVHWLVNPDIVGQLVPTVVVGEERVVISDVKRSILSQAGQRLTHIQLLMPTHLKEQAKHARRSWSNSHVRSATLTLGGGSYPPLSQMPHGSVELFDVREPFCFSHAQKNSVSLGCPGRSTGMLPAQLRPNGNVIFGNGCVTWKSAMQIH